MKDPVTITVNRAEALVLFEYLHRLDDRPDSVDDAEQVVLWRLAGALERTLVEVLAPNYRELLRQARATLTGTDGGTP